MIVYETVIIAFIVDLVFYIHAFVHLQYLLYHHETVSHPWLRKRNTHHTECQSITGTLLTHRGTLTFNPLSSMLLGQHGKQEDAFIFAHVTMKPFFTYTNLLGTWVQNPRISHETTPREQRGSRVPPVVVGGAGT